MTSHTQGMKGEGALNYVSICNVISVVKNIWCSIQFFYHEIDNKKICCCFFVIVFFSELIVFIVLCYGIRLLWRRVTIGVCVGGGWANDQLKVRDSAAVKNFKHKQQPCLAVYFIGTVWNNTTDSTVLPKSLQEALRPTPNTPPSWGH